ncbi:MAG: hypothetical protein ACRCWQ_12660, partial [Bacilli bacterium]
PDTKEVDKVDTTGTEPQVYVLNLAVEKPEPKAISTSLDNKVFNVVVDATTVVYGSVGDDNDKVTVSTYDVKTGQTIVNMPGNNVIDIKAKNDGFFLVEELTATGNKYAFVSAVTNIVTPVFQGKDVVSFTQLFDGTQVIAKAGKDGRVVLHKVNGTSITGLSK